MCGFIFTAVVRVGIVAHSPFFVGHSKALTAVTFGFFALGIPMLVQVLRRAYRINGTTSVLDTTAQIKSAADAAQKLRQHAMDAAEHARLAGLHALEAAAFADRATAQSRQATKDSGIANEASRKADEDVGNDAVT
jgi:xanthine/uracil permease